MHPIMCSVDVKCPINNKTDPTVIWLNGKRGCFRYSRSRFRLLAWPKLSSQVKEDRSTSSTVAQMMTHAKKLRKCEPTVHARPYVKQSFLCLFDRCQPWNAIFVSQTLARICPDGWVVFTLAFHVHIPQFRPHSERCNSASGRNNSAFEQVVGFPGTLREAKNKTATIKTTTM